jgi:hypothetical protein
MNQMNSPAKFNTLSNKEEEISRNELIVIALDWGIKNPDQKPNDMGSSSGTADVCRKPR